MMPAERLDGYARWLADRRELRDDSWSIVVADPEREVREVSPEAHATRCATPATAAASKQGTARTSLPTASSSQAGICCAVPGR